MEHGIFTSVPERAIVASRKLSLGTGCGELKRFISLYESSALDHSNQAFSNQYVSYRLSKGCIRKAILFILWPWSPKGLGCVNFASLCTDSGKRKAGSRGTMLAESSWKKSVPVLHKACFCSMSAYTGAPKQALGTKHCIYLCSISTTLFNRTAGDTSPFLLFQITIEKSCFTLCSQQCGKLP